MSQNDTTKPATDKISTNKISPTKESPEAIPDELDDAQLAGVSGGISGSVGGSGSDLSGKAGNASSGG